LTAIRLSDLHQEVIKAGTGQASETVDLAAIAVSPDSLRVFGAEFDGSIRRWTIGTDETVASGRRPNVNCPGSSSWPALTVSPNGSLLASSDNNCVYVWDASTMKQLAVFVVPGASPTNLLFRDEGTLIIASVDRARRTPSLIRLWNWRTQRVLATVQPKPTFGAESVSSLLAVSLDGRRIALASSTFQTPTTVSIWNADLNAQVGTLPPGDFRALAFSPDGRRVVSVGAKESAVRVWDAERLVLLLTLPDTDSHRGGVIFTRAGQIVAGRTGGGLTIWDTKIRQR
jgi:WD40 repeat protein